MYSVLHVAHPRLSIHQFYGATSILQVFWAQPFSKSPPYQAPRQGWRWAILVIAIPSLLCSLPVVSGHSTPPSALILNHNHPIFYCQYRRSYHVPQIVEDSWQPTAHNASSPAIGPEGLNNLSFALQPAASGRDPEIMAITEEWGDQPSWKTGADLGTSISIFLLHKHRTCCPFS